MNDKERAFNKQYIKKYGGIFLDNDSESGREILKKTGQVRRKLNNYYEDRKSLFFTQNGIEKKILKNVNSEVGKYHPHVNVYCADKDDINAFAGKIDDEYYIGILKGIFLNVRNHIKDYIEDENFEKIPEIGKCLPNAMLNNMVNICMDFFTFHEFFHIMNGHCDYIKDMGIDELCEENEECDTNGMNLQTLEYDADCCAVSSMINEYFRASYMIQESMDGIVAKPNIDSTIQFVSELLITIYIVTSWLNTRRITSREITETYLASMTHPLPGLRTIYTWLTINTIIGGLKIYTSEEIEQIEERSYKSVFAFITKFEDIAYPGFLKIAMDDVALQHLQKIHNNWKTVRELLTVHYCDLAPFEDVNFESIFSRR